MISGRLGSLVSKGILTADPSQAIVARHLDRVASSLTGYIDYKAKRLVRPSLLRRVLAIASKEWGEEDDRPDADVRVVRDHADIKAKTPEWGLHPGRMLVEDKFRISPGTPRGLYVHGDVGTGKSMLLDLFYEEAPIEHKRRMHFHDFIKEVHERMHEFRSRTGVLLDSDVPHTEDAVPVVAQALTSEAPLLCFDEFQVPDPADAVIIARTLGHMFECGAVMVATSNRDPLDLTTSLMSRHLFEPFVDVIYSQCDVVKIGSRVDYRTAGYEREADRAPIPSNMLSGDKGTPARVAEVWRKFSGGEEEGREFLRAGARRVALPRVAGSVARFTFEELLRAPLGASDYSAIASRCAAVIVEDVPALNLGTRDAARRLITLVDQLYERRSILFLVSEVPAQDLFRGEQGPDSPGGIDTVDEGFSRGVFEPGMALSSLFTGEDEVFAFRRCLSRLREMSTKPYWRLAGVKEI